MRRGSEAGHPRSDGNPAMPKKRKRRKPPAIVPRRGPATNLRPAGVHASSKQYGRTKAKRAERRELDDAQEPPGSERNGVD